MLLNFVQSLNRMPFTFVISTPWNLSNYVCNVYSLKFKDQKHFTIYQSAFGIDQLVRSMCGAVFVLLEKGVY